MRTRVAAAVLVTVLLVFPLDVPEQCDQINFRRANPGLCEVNFPFPSAPGGGGGGSDGGLLGTIGSILHHVLGL